ncbi:uncharacterized protein LAESUDRAFT_816623 [Laetiporus sulphureus 93-53]|uniref:RING-type domain-containing protein n=1 Tax=Laetiporus sulphureus 93-53 TaxID=1314785 RepID=A0A165B4S6_9APHY|nr:uncharacterized protein LAESUDRAFT_816623 [Laetiporus sulphureus 93-53]KZT00238.1 hypothetical protein LAESUDRAFT_816623 [Laetiporus sulphureus 93-53]
MHVVSSHHVLSLRTHTRVLDTEKLLSILVESQGQNKGKRRASSPDSAEQSHKRTRTVQAMDGERAEGGGNLDLETRSIPVYQRVFELEYDSGVDMAFPWRRNEAERRLTIWLQEHLPDGTVHLGPLFLRTNRTETFYVCLLETKAYTSHEFLLGLPHVSDGFHMADHDIRSSDLKNPLAALEVLQTSHRAEIRAQLYLETHARQINDAKLTLLPFRLRVEVEASLLCPAIFEPITSRAKGRLNDVEEAQRRILLELFPSRSPLPTSFREAIDIPLLYSILGPAPRLSSSVEEGLMQPRELLPTLLPFQRRSVAWMLAREGKTLNGAGEAAPQLIVSPDELPLFWEEVEPETGQKWYFNRLLGIVSAEKPQEENSPLGGILAEEPGLGKTLECIGLVMLNPAIGRSPRTKRWDADSKVYVKEVKTTLIVTPVALAPQWVDEFARHAPTLKVLMYDGWAKIRMPITEADAMKARQEKRQQLERRSGGRSRGKPTASIEQAVRGKRGKRPVRRGPKRKADQENEDGDMEAEVEEHMDLAEGDDSDDFGIMDWCTYVNTFDVCITTYAVLQHDLTVARPPPTRPRRATVNYGDNERIRSPLVMCEWYRVVMDEVQMVGGGKAEEMVSLIPRLSSFAVSGTPARTQVSDLIHVLKFLRVNDVLSSPRIWPRLLKPAFANEFTALFRRYAIRTVKNAVKAELTIPSQQRFLVPIELGRVERHVYDQAFENALLELGFDARGVAVRPDWDVDTADLRSWLRRLRGICTHPQVGQLQAYADKLHKPGVLKSIGEVLENMRDQNWRSFMEDRRNKVQIMSTIAQLMQHDEVDPNRHQRALDVLLATEKDAQALIGDIEAALAEHAKKGDELKASTAKLRESREQADPATRDKGKGLASSANFDESSDEAESDDDDIPRNPVGDEHRAKKGALQNRLRECRITFHKISFLKGDVYHILGEAFANEESAAYAQAEELRRVLLKGTEEAASRAMMQLSHDASVKALKENELGIKSPYCDQGGIRSHELMTEANEMVDFLNEQSKVLWRWRSQMITLLTRPLSSSDDGEDADGQEYARSLETQGEAEAYLQAYSALLADRREFLTAERTLLDAHNVREAHIRHTKASMKASGIVLEEDIIPLEQLDDEEHLPEHDVLHKLLTDERKALLEGFDTSRAVKSVMIDLNNVAAKIPKDDDFEKIIARDGVKRLRTLLADQGKLMDKLQADLAHFRKAFNERISYFRQLQEISDTVAEATWEGDLLDATAHARTEQAELEAKVNTGRARQRYLDHLAKSEEEGTVDEDDRCCVLCRCEFSRGYITQCAHVFCEACLREWLSKQEAKACPVCRAPIKSDQLQRFSVAKTAEQALNAAPPSIANNELAPKSRRHINYNVIDPVIFQDIQSMESLGSYGSKVQTLVRHILYLQLTDPGAKSIIFSAWADSLHIIQHALNHNGISSLRIDQHRGKQNAAKRFKTDPTISVLLLHGERENAGLNITCASRVFLVESVVHHAFELQAIARIDRMGQTRPTEVYCYYAEDTMEKNILDLAARRGQSLYTKDNSAGTVDVTPFAVASDKTVVDSPSRKVQKGDFVFKTDDMLAIFFPHLFEDIEYLLDSDTSEVNIPSEDHGMQTPPQQEHSSQYVNAIAGPSRLSF